MKEHIVLILGGLAVVLAAAALGVVCVESRKINKQLNATDAENKKATTKLNSVIKDLADKTEIQVKEEVVNKAVQQAVNREVPEAVRENVRNIRNDIFTEINSETRSEIATQRDKLIPQIDQKLREEIDLINKDAIIKDVQARSVELTMDRLTDDLNAIKAKYEKKLETAYNEMISNYREKLDRRIDTMDILDWQRLGYRIYRI